MLEKLQELTDKLIAININNVANLKKYTIIKKILEDKKCFFKMDIEHAYSILRDLGIEEDNIKNIYKELIDINNF